MAATLQMKGEIDSTLSEFQTCLGKSNTTCTLYNASQSTWSVATPLSVTGSNLTINSTGTNVLQRASTSVANIVIVDGASSNIAISNLTFDGNNQLWNWSASHNNLKTFLLGTMANPSQDPSIPIELNLTTAQNISVQNCAFENSARIALLFEGSGITVQYNAFNGGLDTAIYALGFSANPAGNAQINYNNIRDFRGAAIAINRSWGQVAGNTLVHNAIGDVDGIDIDLGTQGGGQIYMTVVNAGGASNNMDVSNNVIDGCAVMNSQCSGISIGYAAPYPGSTPPQLINYGIEINDTVSYAYFTGNQINNHGVAGYVIDAGNTDSVFKVDLDNETVQGNKIAGIIAANDNSVVDFVSIIGGSITENGGWPWYNGSSAANGYGVLVQGNPPPTNSVCIDSHTNLSSNSAGPACGVNGLSSSCNANSGFHIPFACPAFK